MTDQNYRAYLGLGSNLCEPAKQISAAITSLNGRPDVVVTQQSSLYQSKPLGPTDQPNYFNMVIEIMTKLPPLKLLAMLKETEEKLGRIPSTIRWGARIIDIDILLYDNLSMNHPDLIIPHLGLSERDFVLYPLMEINPNLQLPNGTLLKDIIKTLPAEGTLLLPTNAENSQFH